MAFRPTPINVTEVLVMAMALLAMISLMRKKYDSNLPLLFFGLALTFLSYADRMMDPYLFYGSMGLAMIVRFEFLNPAFSKFFSVLAVIGLLGVTYVMVTDVMA